MKKLIIILAVLSVIGAIALPYILKKNNESPQGTSICIRNDYDSLVTVYITIGATPGCISSVLDLPFVTRAVPGQKNMQGTFILQPGDSTLPFCSGTKGFNGVISFNYPPDNCSSTLYPNGLNQFEFILNNSFQAGAPQESIDISCVHGANCIIRVDMETTKPFNAGPLFPSISTFVNTLNRSEIGLPGVYPYGCDTCTMWKSPPSCIQLPQPKQAHKICQIQRDAKKADGIIKVIYLGEAQILK